MARVITSLLSCALVFAAPSVPGMVSAAGFSKSNRRASTLGRLLNGDDAAPPESLREGIDDSSLEGNEYYRKWRGAFLATAAGRALWIKYSRGFRLDVRMGNNSGGRRGSGVEARDYVFAGERLIGATIVLGVEFARSAPLNAAAYPILSSLADSGDSVGREARAVAFLAHEFGHVENARRIGREILRQNQLLDLNEAGYIQYGRDWFNKPEYRQIVSELGAAPAEIMQRREILAEACCDSGNPGMLGQTDAGGGSAGDRAVPTAIPRNLIRGESIVLRSGKNCVGQHPGDARARARPGTAQGPIRGLCLASNEASSGSQPAVKFQFDCEGARQRNPERGLDA